MTLAECFKAIADTAKDPRRVGRLIRKIRMRQTRNSIFHSDYELAMAGTCPDKMLAKMMELFRPRSVLDLGQGTGQTVEWLVRAGVPEVVGVEGSPEAIAQSPFPEKAICWNLNESLDLKRRFDVVYSFEVVEHIHAHYVENLLQSFSRHGDRVVISAARPGQGGTGHFNEQPPEYWIENFRRHGYRQDVERTQKLKDCRDWWWENLLVFAR